MVRGFCCCFVIPTSRAAEENASRLQPPPDWARYASEDCMIFRIAYWGNGTFVQHARGNPRRVNEHNHAVK
ncbi:MULTISPECIES: hypothetical protein [Paenibacillus]|uniref:hypothetical protein n=1 Tax=Paenibacillus TaxID=44249 RepID=UPI00203FA0EE|nr:hypothetical protein [Paenibacillus illinoisensis]MBY0219491.1 hypothetical protein [Paenibacillus illinoisensis]MCM3204378.1 hypothetical protein [Paenibacillus illinoisensis]